MDIWILDDSLRIRVFYANDDCDLEDNICLEIFESCPQEEKIFKTDETHVFLKKEEALQLARALYKAVDHSQE